MRIGQISEDPRSVNEGLKDYVGLVGNALAGIVSARHRGKAEVSKVLLDAKKNFTQHMGRNGQKWDTVTWNTLYKYLSMPDQLGLTGTEITKIFKDQTVQSKILDLISKQTSKQVGGSASSQRISTDVMKQTWSKSSQLIGGPDDMDSAKRAEIAVTYLLELGAIKWLERSDRTQEMPDDGPEQQPARSPEATQTQAAASKLDPTVIDKIKQELAKLKGTTP